MNWNNFEAIILKRNTREARERRQSGSDRNHTRLQAETFDLGKE